MSYKGWVFYTKRCDVERNELIVEVAAVFYRTLLNHRGREIQSENVPFEVSYVCKGRSGIVASIREALPQIKTAIDTIGPLERILTLP